MQFMFTMIQEEHIPPAPKKNKKKIIKAKPINMNLDAPMQRFCLPDFVESVAVAADQKRPSIKI